MALAVVLLSFRHLKMFRHTHENIRNTKLPFVFLNFPFMSQHIYAYLKLNRPRLAIVYCYSKLYATKNHTCQESSSMNGYTMNQEGTENRRHFSITQCRLWPGYLVILPHRGISQMTYQPMSVGKISDFETLTFCVSLNSNQMCTYFCKDLVTGYCLYLLKKSYSQPSFVFKLILLPKPCCYGLDVTWNSCIWEPGRKLDHSATLYQQERVAQLWSWWVLNKLYLTMADSFYLHTAISYHVIPGNHQTLYPPIAVFFDAKHCQPILVLITCCALFLKSDWLVVLLFLLK